MKNSPLFLSVLKYILLVLGTFTVMFALTYALGVATRPQPLKKASIVWWPETEKEFYTAHKWAPPLKEGFKNHGYDLRLATELTPGLYEQLISSDIILLAYPVKKGFAFPFEHFKKGTQIYLWAHESPIVMEQPVKLVDTRYFKKIFTWRTDLVDHQKTFFTPLDTRVDEKINIPTDLSHKRILMMQIAGNHYQYETAQTIYSKRRKATLWWLKNHPNEYEFYGNGWPLVYDSLDEKTKAAFKASYKGYAPDKIKTLSQALFALTFENTVHNDYVTEKIYDVMKAGTVPVYLGAQNITDFVPEECFINYADFKNDEEVYAFIKQITPEQYQAYLTCIQNFLKSEKINSLMPQAIANSLLKEIF